MTEKILTSGAVALEKVLTPTMTGRVLAERLGVTPQSVSGWVNGWAKPGRAMAVKIEELTGVPVAAWEEEPAKEGGEAS